MILQNLGRGGTRTATVREHEWEAGRGRRFAVGLLDQAATGWSFDLAFAPQYRPQSCWPHQEHVARLLASGAAEVSLELRDLRMQREEHPRDLEKYSFIQACQAPSCGKLFFTGKKAAVVCPRPAEKGHGKSDCRKEYDAFLRFAVRKHTAYIDQGGHAEFPEFVDRLRSDPETLRCFSYRSRTADKT